jgi:hypothetical protein
MSEYRIQRIGANEFKLLIPLMQDCFGMEVNLRYFQWKYLDNPAGHFIGFVAIEEETAAIGAYYGVIPQMLIISGLPRKVYQSCDTMTHSAHRRRGLFQKLALECYRYLRETDRLFVIGYGGANSTPGFLKFGWQQVFDFRYYFKPALLCSLSGSKKEDAKEFTVETTLEFLDDWKTPVSQHNAIHSVRSSIHTRWRMNNPLHHYHCISYRKSTQVQGYVIYYIDGKKLVLFDFGFTNSSATKALMSLLNGLVIRNKYKGIVAFCQEDSVSAQLIKRQAFLSNPFRKGPLHEKTPFIFFATDSEMNTFKEPSHWQMTGYDHDAF